MKLRRLRNRPDQASAAGLSCGSKLATAISAAALLAGCSSVPDEVNPVEWYRGASAWVAGDAEEVDGETSTVTAPDSEDVPFPNLASVPERPEPTPEPGEVEEMIASLESDRADAKAADAELRSTTIARSEPATAIPLPAPAPSDEATSDARRFPPLALPDLRSSLGDKANERTGRFSDVDREEDTPVPPSPERSSTPRPEPQAAPEVRPALPARDLASVRDVAPRPPVQPPEPFATGRRSFASATATGTATPTSGGGEAAAASARVAPRPPIQPPQPYSAPRSSVSDSTPAQRPGSQTSLAQLPR